MNIHIFGQPDTLIPNVYDPQSLNRYMFERGNPYRNVDPTGHYAVGLLRYGLTLFANYEIRNFPETVRNALTVGPVKVLFDVFSNEQSENKLAEDKATAEQYVKDNPEYETVLVTDVPNYKSPYYTVRKINNNAPNPLLLPKVFNEANGAAQKISPEKDKSNSGSSGGQCGVNMSCSSSGSAYGSSNQAERTKTGQAAAAARRVAASAGT